NVGNVILLVENVICWLRLWVVLGVWVVGTTKADGDVEGVSTPASWTGFMAAGGDPYWAIVEVVSKTINPK
ncbi:hypothetical protein Dimus_025059, partial [Dionaea muscipula]